MRIITGEAKGRRLETLDGEETRPTSERVKEAMFSMIQFDIEGRRVLDLFGGSGQLALEALSRGAEYAVIIDSNPAAAEVIKRNAKSTRLDARCRVSATEYDAFLKYAAGRESFDIIFLDPPYKSGFIPRALSLIDSGKIAKPTSLLICEYDSGDIFGGDEKLSSKYKILKTGVYGRVKTAVIAPI
ncbi:MAG: 16S rRNA (guanine(966)-N(2))-methyltransferase RsmD [Firmicutes bacterium]|nr:16S rRNA (guanine(966)-N(2))-methyltransferase RsmD [Bacillota bacterium]